MRVLCQVRPALAARIAAAVPEVEVVTIPFEGEVPADASGEVLLMLPWNSPNLDALLARGVRWVHALGTGVDRFPFERLGERLLTCSRGGSAGPIAEWVLTMMLAFEKRLPEAWIREPPADGWSRARLGTLAGKTLGLVGIGGIGLAVAERALPFDMRVLAYRRTAAPPSLEGIALVDSVAALASESDHLVLAAPATPATHHLIDRAVLAAIKPGAHIINIARGALVDQDALREALDDGRVARASLDAVEPEPLPAGHWLYTHPRVRLSPHVSWSAPGAAEVLVDAFIDNLRLYLRGEPLNGVVDTGLGY